MDSNSPVSPETLQSDLALELEQLKHELQIAEGKIMQLELALLQSRDFAIGAAAEAGEALKFEKINKDLRTQIETLHNSATWRIGRKVMLPIRIIKRIVK